jgi:uncharacterized iron-regulated membrane protein
LTIPSIAPEILQNYICLGICSLLHREQVFKETGNYLMELVTLGSLLHREQVFKETGNYLMELVTLGSLFHREQVFKETGNYLMELVTLLLSITQGTSIQRNW